MGIFSNLFKIKSIFLFLLVCGAVFVFADFNQVSAAIQKQFDKYFIVHPCDVPISYKIGTIDPKFNLSETTVLADSKQAVEIWDKSYGNKDLFILNQSDPKALTINLVYDSRSALNNKISDLKDQLNQKDQSLQNKIANYEQQVTEFKKSLADFNAKVTALNQEIKYWNQQGGAPQDEYQKLIQEQSDLKKEQQSLQAEGDSLNQTAKSLNLSTENYNNDVDKLNSTITSFDNALSQKPEEGLYDPSLNTISIYFASNKDELIHTLTHELGHALGLAHNENKDSIMYPYTSQTISPSTDDISALMKVCSQKYFNIPYLDKYQELIRNLIAKL